MNEQAIRFRIGIFVLAGLIALGVLIILFGGLPYFFLPSTSYSVLFDNAHGLASGSPVKRSGVKIGTVRRVTLDETTGQVDVLIQIDNGHILRRGDRATLIQGVLGGDSTIAFLPPPGKKEVDTTPVEPGSVLVGYVQADTGTLLQRTTEAINPAEEALKEIKKSLEKLTPAAEDTLRDIRNTVPPAANTIQENVQKLSPTVQKLLEKIDKAMPVIESAFAKFDKLAPVMQETFEKIDKDTLPSVRKTLDEFQVLSGNWNKVGERLNVLIRTNEDKLTKTIDRTDEALKRINQALSDENQKNFSETLKNVRVASDRFDSIAKNTDELMKDSRVTLKTMNDSMLKLDRVLTDIQKATKPLADRGDSILKNVDESTDKLNKVLDDVRNLLQAVAHGNGTVQKLLSDPSLYNNLNEASLCISRLMPRFDYILRDIEIFADKLARHPELLGIRGAIAPGSGLKESPSQYKVFPHCP